MSTTTPSTSAPAPLPYAAPRPRRSRFNWRLPLFLAVTIGAFLGLAYLVIMPSLNHGISKNGQFLEVDLKLIGNFPFDQANGTINDIPAEFRALDGKKVLLEGFMYAPRNAGDRGTEFQFVYNVSKCCFNGPPQVQERVYGTVRSGDVQIYDMYTFVRVTGTLHVRVVKDEAGAIHSVYDLDVESAKPV